MRKTFTLVCLAALVCTAQNAGAADADVSRYPYTWSEGRYGGPGSWSAARYGGPGSYSASKYGGPGSWNASRYGGVGSWSAGRYGGSVDSSGHSTSGWGRFGENPSAGWSGESAQERTRSELLLAALSRSSAQRNSAQENEARELAIAVPSGHMSSSQQAAFQLGTQVKNTFTGILQHEFGSLLGKQGNPQPPGGFASFGGYTGHGGFVNYAQ